MYVVFSPFSITGSHTAKQGLIFTNLHARMRQGLIWSTCTFFLRTMTLNGNTPVPPHHQIKLGNS